MLPPIPVIESPRGGAIGLPSGPGGGPSGSGGLRCPVREGTSLLCGLLLPLRSRLRESLSLLRGLRARRRSRSRLRGLSLSPRTGDALRRLGEAGEVRHSSSSPLGGRPPSSAEGLSEGREKSGADLGVDSSRSGLGSTAGADFLPSLSFLSFPFLLMLYWASLDGNWALCSFLPWLCRRTFRFNSL